MEPNQPKEWIWAFTAVWLIASLVLGTANSSAPDIQQTRTTPTTTYRPRTTTTTYFPPTTYLPPITRPVYYTDWELSNAFIEPTNPNEGEAVSFGAALRVLSTNMPFPQTVLIEVLGAGIVGSISVTYPGPTGLAMIIETSRTWSLEAGDYTVYLIADPPLPYQYNDPNRANNQASVSFRVAEFDFRLEAVIPVGGLEAVSDHPNTSRRIASCTINVVLVSGSPELVFLNATCTPPPLHLPGFTFDRTSGMPTFSSILHIDCTEVWSGTFSIAVSGNGGGKIHSTTILLTVKGYSSIEVHASPSIVDSGQAVTVDGMIVPHLDPGDPLVIVRYTRPNGTYFERTVPSDTERGYVSDRMIPDAIGSWTVQASWPGNDHMIGCTSNISTFEMRWRAPPLSELQGLILGVAPYAVSGAAFMAVAYFLWRRFRYA